MIYLKNSFLIVLMLVSLSFNPFHHGWADYDQTTTLDYTGIILEFKNENPHATAKVKDKNKVWLTVLAPPSRMKSREVPIDKLKKGASVRFVGYPHKEIKDEMRIERIYVDGIKYELR